MLTSVDATLKGINASTSGMKKSEKAHAHSGLLSNKKTFQKQAQERWIQFVSMNVPKLKGKKTYLKPIFH